MDKVLIANRGEIAVRIIRACKDLGIQTVAVYSEADSEALHVLHADEAICIGEAPVQQSYLNIPNILSACEITGADAIHPGYGFLAENANFASICETCGINFIGPSAETISSLGDKARAKEMAALSHCPVVPGSDGIVDSESSLQFLAKKMGYPLMIKAVAGGGGRGIRPVFAEDELIKAYHMAKSESEVCFGNGDVYVERMILNPRHIEIQIVGDKYGNYVHLGERDCTIQRRKQKLIEESPSPVISDKLRKKMGKAAIAVVKAAGYHSVGTVEFLLDSNHEFYFMEVNTRIQVEHTVSEEWMGMDLVVEQLKIARGDHLSVKQKDLQPSGHVIQCRINAEDARNNFSPSPGFLDYYLAPGGPHVRVDSACYSGYKIPPYYDSMIAKLIVKGRDRKEAFARLKRALMEFHIGGVESTIPFHLRMLEDIKFIEADYDLNYIDQLMEDGVDLVVEVD